MINKYELGLLIKCIKLMLSKTQRFLGSCLVFDKLFYVQSVQRDFCIVFLCLVYSIWNIRNTYTLNEHCKTDKKFKTETNHDHVSK